VTPPDRGEGDGDEQVTIFVHSHHLVLLLLLLLLLLIAIPDVGGAVTMPLVLVRLHFPAAALARSTPRLSLELQEKDLTAQSPETCTRVRRFFYPAIAQPAS
jgi:hypothetical protein